MLRNPDLRQTALQYVETVALGSPVTWEYLGKRILSLRLLMSQSAKLKGLVLLQNI